MSGVILGGPMFEGAETEHWKSCFNKTGAHYNIYYPPSPYANTGMDGLKEMFPDAKADEMNFCLFSTSGVHGMYTTIEEVEAWILRGEAVADWAGGEGPDLVTFLIVHPRIVCLRYGNCRPKTPDDFTFLKRLRASSWDAVKNIGRDDTP